MGRLFGIDLGNELVPDEATICKFRHLLEAHYLGERIFKDVSARMGSKGLRLSAGTIIGATIINAPPSRKNGEDKRDPEMRSTKKRKHFYFGVKIHVGVYRGTKLATALSLRWLT